MPSPATLIRDARRDAGLTQASLATRMGVPQSVVARLERPGSNPTWDTIERALYACGKRIAVEARASVSSIDETLVAAHLRIPPGERIKNLTASYASTRRLALAGARSRGELA
jgi:transcriptional regulator with XRE-family HTH domain